MGRVARGSVTERSGKLYARVTLKSGKRVLHLLGERAALSDAEAARLAIVVSDGYRSGRFAHPSEEPKLAATGETKGPEETVGEWFARWTLERGTWISHVGSERSKYKHRIHPFIGDIPLARVTREDCERLVEHLDAMSEAEEITGKTAVGTWTVACAMFRDAYSGKDKRFRARKDDPTHDVAAPDLSDEKAKVYLYPSEAEQLLACDEIPVERRQLYALAAYSGLRASEMSPLRWADIDLVADVIDVVKAEDRSKRTIRSTKNHETRRVPLDPALRPILEAMRDGNGLVVDVPISKLAESFRKDLRRAGLTRPALFTSSLTQKPMTFHDLRATAITWWALQGLPLHAIMRRAGHRSTDTTMRYVREAETLGRAIGTPFPPLPASLRKRHQQSAPTAKDEGNMLRTAEPPWGLEPQEAGQEDTKPGETEGANRPLTGDFGPVLAPGAKSLVPLPMAMESLRSACRPRGPILVRYRRLLDAANDVLGAWDRGAA